MDKNIIKETMLSLEGAALQSAREKYFEYVADARPDRSEPIERDEQAQAEIASDLSEALDDTLHDHTDKLDKLREAFSARVTNSPPPTFGGQGPLKRAGLAGLFEKQYYVQSAKAYKPAQIVYHMVAQNWTSRLPTAAWSPPTCGTHRRSGWRACSPRPSRVKATPPLPIDGLPQPNIVAKDTIDLAAKAAAAW
jgi:hypothetical protein